MQEKLAEIHAALEQLVQNPEAGVYVSGEHALDESLLFGTSDAYLRLAAELVKAVLASQRGELDVQEMGGLEVQTSSSISSAFDSCSEIIFDNGDLVKTESEARQLFEYLWDSQQETKISHHMANYNNVTFQNCDFTNAELKRCKLSGMTIDGIAVEELIKGFKKNK